MNKISLTIYVILIAVTWLTACGPGEEELAGTSLAETAVIYAATLTAKPSFTHEPTATFTPSPTPTSTFTPTPTATPTLTPTITPTHTPTATPTPSDIEIYFPHDENTVWWYALSLNGVSGGLDSVSVIGTDILDDGSTVYLMENKGEASIGYQEVKPDQVNLIKTVFSAGLEDQINTDFIPPIPILQSPLEVGRTWSREPKPGSGEIPLTYEIVSIEEVSVSAGDFQNCFFVERTSNGITNYRDYYCPEVGRALYEVKTDRGWVRSELVVVTSVRAEKTQVQDLDFGCVYSYKTHGFSPEELITISLHLQDQYSTILIEDMPLANSTFMFPLSLEYSQGTYLLLFEGDSNFAYDTIDWSGKCEEMEKQEN
jgi:hypothetical protein